MNNLAAWPPATRAPRLRTVRKKKSHLELVATESDGHTNMPTRLHAPGTICFSSPSASLVISTASSAPSSLVASVFFSLTMGVGLVVLEVLMYISLALRCRAVL
jgi:hypothetical protein